MKKDDIRELLDHSLGGSPPDELYHLTEEEHRWATSYPMATEPGLMPAGVLRGIQLQPVPKDSSSPGMPGMQAVDEYWYYYCVSLNSWVRKALSTWVEESSSSSSSHSSGSSSSSSSLIFSHSSNSSSSESSD